MMLRSLLTTALFTQLFVAFTLPAYAQYAPNPTPAAQAPAPAATTIGGTATTTAKIIAIDYNARTVTLQDQKGNVQQMQVGPSVTRFNNLKVGDTVTFTYQESVALAMAKPGAAMPTVSSTPTVTQNAGEKPGGTVSQTQTTTVTVTAIDPSKPSVTVKTQDGRVLSFLVQDPKNLNGIKVGDVIQVTYTQAMMVTVK